MLSRTILAQSIFSEDQFIADLTSLFRRRNISFGEPQDLERLASDLVADGAFRGALFNLCTVISHMGEIEFTPHELLVLVARASGGPRIFDAEGNAVIPHNTESAFLTGYEAWIHRDPELEAASERRHSEPFHEAMVRSAAEGPRTAPSRQHSPSPPSPPRPIPSNAPLDSLTLGELRQYLDEIERRVSQIEPHLDQVVRTEQAARNTAPSTAYLEQLDAVESERIHEVIPLAPIIEPTPPPIEETPAPAPEPELAAESMSPAAPAEEAPALIAESIKPTVPVEEPPVLAAESIQPTASVEEAPALAAESIQPTASVEEAPALAVESMQLTAPVEEAPALTAEPMSPAAPAEEAPTLATLSIVSVEAPALATLSIVSVEAPALAIQPQATHATLDAARLRRLRVANVILAILLVISTVFAGFVAFRYVNSSNQPANLAATPDQPPAASAEPASSPTVPQTSQRTTPPPSTSHPAPATGNDTKPPQISQAAPAATAPPDAVVFPTSIALPEMKSPAPVIRQAPEPAAANPAPTQAASPPAEAKPAESPARPNQQNDMPPARPTPAPPPPQLAEAAPAPAPATAPAPRTPEPATTTVNVPSSKMMAYAIAKPAPVPPPTRHNTSETTVEVVAIISKEGKVTSAQALSGTADVRPAAIQAMQAWRFKPYLVNGKPVEVITTFKFLFKGQ